MSKEKQKNRIVPINNKLYDSMFVTNIESRLESDPLLTGSLIDLQYVDERIELCINGGNCMRTQLRNSRCIRLHLSWKII